MSELLLSYKIISNLRHAKIFGGKSFRQQNFWFTALCKHLCVSFAIIILLLTISFVSCKSRTVADDVLCSLVHATDKCPWCEGVSPACGQYRWHLTRRPSVSAVNISNRWTCCSHIIRQKSATVFGRGPCEPMYLPTTWVDGVWPTGNVICTSTAITSTTWYTPIM